MKKKFLLMMMMAAFVSINMAVIGPQKGPDDLIDLHTEASASGQKGPDDLIDLHKK